MTPPTISAGLKILWASKNRVWASWITVTAPMSPIITATIANWQKVASSKASPQAPGASERSPLHHEAKTGA